MPLAINSKICWMEPLNDHIHQICENQTPVSFIICRLENNYIFVDPNYIFICLNIIQQQS